MSDEHLSTLAFESLPLHPTIMQGILEAGFTLCTPIQAQTMITTPTDGLTAGADAACTGTRAISGTCAIIIRERRWRTNSRR